MFKRPRLTVRLLMIVVAVVAILLAILNEVRYRVRRDISARSEAYFRDRAAEQEQERDFCLAHQGTAYDREKREFEHGIISLGYYRDWLDEANQHAEYIETYRKAAEESAARKRAAQQHLIFP